MASGLDHPHPSGNNDLLSRVGDLGIPMSEPPPGAAATITPEAGYRSSSLHVAKEAHDLGRPAGAMPGPITSAASAGTHRLIQEGIAPVVTNANSIREVLTDPRGSLTRTFGASVAGYHRIVLNPTRSL